MTSSYQRNLTNLLHDLNLDPNRTDIEYLAKTLHNVVYVVWFLGGDMWGDAFDAKYRNSTADCLTALKDNQGLAEECWKSLESKDLDWIPVFTLLEKEKVGQQFNPYQNGEAMKASQFAWETDFIGEAHLKLLATMRNHAALSYSMITPIVQSSGMGKSRTVDELAKHIFTIPICLRQPFETGYPCGDEPLLTFFDRVLPKQAQRFCFDLLGSIMREISRILQSTPIDNDLAYRWYEQMKPSNGAPSPVRTLLYTNACNNLDNSDDEISAFRHLRTEFEALRGLLPKGSPRAIIYIDECQYLRLRKAIVYGKEYNLLDTMLQAIGLLGGWGLYGITLSTNPSFDPPRPRVNTPAGEREQKLEIGNKMLPRPFTGFPFDEWNGEKIITEGKSTLHEVCTLEFSARFGRPLWWTWLMNPETKKNMLDNLVAFAAMKLTLNGEAFPLSEAAEIAALSARLCFQFDSLHYTRLLKNRLVERHMAVVYYFSAAHKNHVESGYSSEPILAEGAAHIWAGKAYAGFDPLEILRKIATNGFLAKGERDKLIAQYICLRAHDICVADGGPNLIGDKDSYGKAVPLVLFFKALFGPQWGTISSGKARNQKRDGDNFETACEGKYVRFTHFAITIDDGPLSTAGAWKGLARANAWIFSDCKAGVDLGIPVFTGDPGDALSRETVTWIFIQIKDPMHHQTFHFSAESLGAFRDGGFGGAVPYFVLVFQISVQPPSEIRATTSHSTTSHKEGPRTSSSRKVIVRQNMQDPLPNEHPCYWVDVIECSSEAFNSKIVPEGTTAFTQILAADEDSEKDDYLRIITNGKWFKSCDNMQEVQGQVYNNDN